MLPILYSWRCRSPATLLQGRRPASIDILWVQGVLVMTVGCSSNLVGLWAQIWCPESGNSDCGVLYSKIISSGKGFREWLYGDMVWLWVPIWDHMRSDIWLYVTFERFLWVCVKFQRHREVGVAHNRLMWMILCESDSCNRYFKSQNHRDRVPICHSFKFERFACFRLKFQWHRKVGVAHNLVMWMILCESDSCNRFLGSKYIEIEYPYAIVSYLNDIYVFA